MIEVGQPEREILEQRRRRYLARYGLQTEQRLDFGRKGKTTLPCGVVERLDAETVANERHPARLPVDDREGVHAGQPFERRLAPAHPGGEQDFGIGGRTESFSGS